MSKQKKPATIKPAKGWVIVTPSGLIDWSALGKTQIEAWSNGSIFDPEEAKRDGYRAVRVTVTPC